MLGNDCDSASSFSFKIMLVRGEDSGGDCANILPALPSKEFGGDQHILWVLVFDGMGLAPLGWQINASPSSVIENKLKILCYKFVIIIVTVYYKLFT